MTDEKTQSRLLREIERWSQTPPRPRSHNKLRKVRAPLLACCS